MHRYSILFLIFSIILSSGSVFAQNQGTFDKVVIDAGHGGNKPGALGSKYKEKDVTLAVAIKLGKLINENLKSVKVYYTRVIDQDVDLYKRSTVANKINADLFISIHCNSSTSKAAAGTETYAMGLGKTANNLEVAKKENAEMLTEANAIENYSGFDANSPEADILMSLYQNAYLNNSLEFASKVQEEYSKAVPMKSRGVHQANFVVLWKASMPAVLTEIGFISNSKEEQYIGSEYGQWVIASCIFRAICHYRNKVDNLSDAIPAITALIPKDVQEKEKLRQQNEALMAEQAKQQKLAAAAADTVANNNNAPVAEQQKNGVNVLYRVQFMSNPQKIALADVQFANLDDVYAYQEKGSWKYTAGVFASQKEALAYLKTVKEKYKDAFVVAFSEGKRISIVEAKRLTGK